MKLTFKNIDVHYTSQGNGDAVVLLHGFLEQKEIWDNITLALANTNQVIAIDLLGHGKTGCLGYIHTMESMSNAVVAVLNHLQITKAKFIGHSMGGYVALSCAKYHSNMVSSVVLMNSSADADSDEKKLNRDRAIKVVKKMPENFIGMALANLFSEENREQFSSAIIDLKAKALQTPTQGVIAALEGMKMRESFIPFLLKENIRIAFIIGEKDPVMPIENALQQVEILNAPYKVLSGGHMSYLEAMDDCILAIKQFIA